MKLDRNIPNNAGRGKYALVRLRDLDPSKDQQAHAAYLTLLAAGVIDSGVLGATDEFFVMKLRDKYAAAALTAYAEAAVRDDPEWAQQVRGLADRAGPYHPECKRPD